MRIPAAILTSSMVALAFAGAAQAQTSDQPAAQEAVETTGGLEDIVVTAQRRSENLQAVPIAITAVTSAGVARQNIVNLETLATNIPSLSVTRQANAANVFLRGVGGQSSTVGTEQSVITFIDDVYVPGAAANVLEFNNISRIEVLKGPQGTLFGRNAVGGVVNIATLDPSYDPEMKFDLSYASYRTVIANAYVSGGLGENLAANLSAHYEDRSGGWGDNVFLGTNTYTKKSAGLRGKVVWEPGYNTKVTLIGDYIYYDGAEGIDRSLVQGTLGVGATPSIGFYDTQTGVDPVNRVESIGGSLKVEQQLGDLSLVSITAYRKQESFFDYDLDSVPTPAARATIDQYEDTFTQEVRLGSSEGRLKWVAGLYYFSSRHGQDPRFIALPGLLLETVATGKPESVAGFAQATFEVTPQLSVTGGIRYTWDKRTIDTFSRTNGVINPAQTNNRKLTTKKPTWRLAVDYKIDDNTLVYASYNRGYKTGAFDFGSTTNPPVLPEKLDAYEVGFKADMFDRTVRLNAAAFWYDWSNIQLTQLLVVPGGGTASRLLNAAKARIRGFDADFTIAPGGGFTLSGNFAYLDGTYKSFPNGPHFVPNGAASTCDNPAFLPGYPGGQSLVAGCDFTGLPTINTPKWSGAVTAAYTAALGSGTVDAALTYSYNDGFSFEPDRSIVQPSYSLLNGSLKYSTDDGLWVKVWGRNLTDKKYLATGVSGASGRFYAPAEPRTIGFTVGVELGR